jgi:hypothetical protein
VAKGLREGSSQFRYIKVVTEPVGIWIKIHLNPALPVYIAKVAYDKGVAIEQYLSDLNEK